MGLFPPLPQKARPAGPLERAADTVGPCHAESWDEEASGRRSEFHRLHFSPLFGPPCGRQIIFQND